VLFTILAIAGAYLSGSVPYGAIVARRRGIDIQTVGSKNIGATNVARSLGKKLGALVLLLDAAKGALPVAVALHFSGDLLGWAAPAVGLAAVVGHCFPVWLRWRGGKGVATALGVFLVIDPVASGISVSLFIMFYAAFRMASIGSLVGTVAFPGALWWRVHPVMWVVLAGIIAVLIVARHHENLRRLMKGEERAA
jgi:glycerol-3-phosphate acyltransferase PlsY